MLKIILLVFGGFIAGIVSTVLLSMYFVSRYATLPSEPTESSLPGQEFSLSSEAYENATDCPSYPLEKLVGNWYGQKTLDNGDLQKWKVTRSTDGTYQINFEISSSEGKQSLIENGLWSYSGCLYSVIGNSFNGQRTLFQEVYRVQELTDDKFTYTNYRTGRTYTVIKGI